jgi:hypothetical protein
LRELLNRALEGRENYENSALSFDEKRIDQYELSDEATKELKNELTRIISEETEA